MVSDDESSQEKKGRKLQVNSGQLDSKTEVDNSTHDLEEMKRGSISSKSNFSTLQVTTTSNEKARYDRNGN